jgi:hypothetical protein
MRSVLDSGEALQGVLPSDFVPSHAVYFGAGGRAEYAIDAWLYTSAQEYHQPWWAQDDQLQAMATYEPLDGNYDAVASQALPIGWKRHDPSARRASEEATQNGHTEHSESDLEDGVL